MALLKAVLLPFHEHQQFTLRSYSRHHSLALNHFWSTPTPEELCSFSALLQNHKEIFHVIQVWRSDLQTDSSADKAVLHHDRISIVSNLSTTPIMLTNLWTFPSQIKKKNRPDTQPLVFLIHVKTSQCLFEKIVLIPLLNPTLNLNFGHNLNYAAHSVNDEHSMLV